MKFSRDCVYLSPKLDEASQLRLTEIKEKVGSLERQLERDVAKTTSRAAQQQAILADDVEDEFAEERDLEPTDMTALDVTYDEDADGTDDLIDLGVQVGRMRITERIGGLSRPRIAEEVRIWTVVRFLGNILTAIRRSLPGFLAGLPVQEVLPALLPWGRWEAWEAWEAWEE